MDKGDDRYVGGIANSKFPSMGVLQVELMRTIWEHGKPMRTNEVFYALFLSRRKRGLTTYKPQTIKKVLMEMKKKGFVIHQWKDSKYTWAYPQEIVTVGLMNDSCVYLTGFPLEELLEDYLPEGMTLTEIIKIEVEKRISEQHRREDYERLLATVNGHVGEREDPGDECAEDAEHTPRGAE